MKKTNSKNKIEKLRNLFYQFNIDGLIVPVNDHYQDEWVAPQYRRLAWITHFTGSAGTAIILKKEAYLFVDGRYTTQAKLEVDSSIFKIIHTSKTPLTKWLNTLPQETNLGYDPWLHTQNNKKLLQNILKQTNSKLSKLEHNLVDIIWEDRPNHLSNEISAHPIKFAGESSQKKRKKIAKLINHLQGHNFILTSPESISWLLNIRGADLEYTPIALSYAILSANTKLVLFINPKLVPPKVKSHLGEDVTILSMHQFSDHLDSLSKNSRKILIDPNQSSSWIFDKLKSKNVKIIETNDPCNLPKSCKNSTELKGIRSAHIRDGIALTNFLFWLDKNIKNNSISELDAIEKIDFLRSQNTYFKSLSFPTIAGSGSNGAIVHYRANNSTNRKISSGDLFLIDSGGQYLDGTTDVTRTIAIGEPSQEQCDRFTRVLKGHIAIASTIFVEGTTGSQLDVLARLPLWEIGLDFEHGTGHGVGAFLNVHEGPQRISKLSSNVPLKPGMIISNEPGYYKEGEYGIRIENLIAVTESKKNTSMERKNYEFETLTLAPIDIKLIDSKLMNANEINWLNTYHEKVFKTLSPLLNNDTQKWLSSKTKNLIY